MPCAYCKVVNRVCFWGPMPHAQWKRPALFVLGLVGTLGFGWFAWKLQGHAQSWVIVPLLSVLVLASAFGLLVAVNGCAACVARFFGNA
jgi:hypothetical protein